MSNTAQSPEAPQGATEQSISSENILVASNTDSIPTLKNREHRRSSGEKHSPMTRLAIATSMLFLAAIVGLVGYYNPGEQPFRLLSVIVVTLCALALTSEAIPLTLASRNIRLGFDALSWLGALSLVGAVILALATETAAPAPLVALAPAIGCAVFFFSRAITVQARRSARNDSYPLFPEGYVPGAHITEGSSLSVQAGSVVTIDASISRGSVAVDERSFSTIPTFRVREEGDVLYAGSQILAGSADITALSTQKTSCLSQLQDACAPMIDRAERGLVREDERAAYWTLIGVAFISVAAAISWSERSQGGVQSLLGFGTLALVAGLCQVAEALYGMRRALVRSALAKGFVLTSSSALKELAGVSSIVVDPSRVGHGSRHLATDLEILDDRLSRPALCDFLASLLGRADDPLLSAAGDYCRRGTSKLSVERVLDLREYPGRGILGTIHGVELSIGNEDFLVERGIMVQPSDGDRTELPSDHMLLVAIADDIVARFHISDSQEDLLTDEEHIGAHGISVAVSSGIANHLSNETLLVRGPESDLVGQVASHDVRLVTPQALEIRPATVLALTPELKELPLLIAESKRQARVVERTRVLIGVSGFIVVGCVFGGILTPLVPLGCLALLAGSLRLP